jgi:tungstate transport system substrate-binding protein
MFASAYRSAIVLVALGGALAAACGGGDGLLLATTPSVNDSGLLDELVPLFEDESGVNVKVIAVGTGAALRMAELGNTDALFVHAPDSEQALVTSGDVINRQLVVYNDFLIAGPPADPAGLAHERDITVALSRIAAAGAEGAASFVSRGDDSGTHKRELALWSAAGIEPGGDWYAESGQGMGASLNIASQRRSYILTDRATFLALGEVLDLVPLAERDSRLINLYSAMQVNPDKGQINGGAAADWVAFITRADVQARIGAFRAIEFGRPLFVPAAGQTEAQAMASFAASAADSATELSSGSSRDD